MSVSTQETFDIVARHLLTQGVRSVDAAAGGEVLCRYRSSLGLKCAVGVLIPDDLYTPSMESNPVVDDPVRSVIDGLGHDLSLCEELQELHDDVPVCEWDDALRKLAHDWNLSSAVIDEVNP